MYIDFFGRISTQIFIKDSEMYAKVETDYDFRYSTNYFEKIKASEYHKIKESNWLITNNIGGNTYER